MQNPQMVPGMQLAFEPCLDPDLAVTSNGVVYKVPGRDL